MEVGRAPQEEAAAWLPEAPASYSSPASSAHPLALQCLLLLYGMCSQDLTCASGSDELSVREALKSSQPVKKTDVNHLFLQKRTAGSERARPSAPRYRPIALSVVGQKQTQTEAPMLRGDGAGGRRRRGCTSVLGGSTGAHGEQTGREARLRSSLFLELSFH